MFVPTIIVETAVPTRVVGTTAREMIVPTMIVGTVVPTMIVGTAVPTIIVLTAYYWKSCLRHPCVRSTGVISAQNPAIRRSRAIPSLKLSIS